ATRRVTVGADRDDTKAKAGEKAAGKLGLPYYRKIPVAIALPGHSGEYKDWLDILNSDGVDAVRAGLLNAQLFEPTEAEIADQARDQGRAAELQQIRHDYPLPKLNGTLLAYRQTMDGEIWLHKFAGQNGDGSAAWDPIATPFGVPARLRYVDQDDAYGLRVVLRDMNGRQRMVDFERADLARM